MLITLSGVDGTGKTTIGKLIVETLAARNAPATYLRFRFLSCFAPLGLWPSGRRRAPERPAVIGRAPGAAPEGQGYRRRRLTLPLAIGYLLRIVAFRYLALPSFSGKCVILDRYFYDSFVHFELTRRRERTYWALLKRWTPRPDFALWTTASEATVRSRRHLADEYYYLLTDGYERLAAELPELVVVRTDDLAASRDALAPVLGCGQPSGVEPVSTNGVLDRG